MQAFLDKRASAEMWRQLEKAVAGKDASTPELLQKVPENLRDPDYWRLAFQYYNTTKDLQKKGEAASQWLKSKPTGLLASEAQLFAKAYDAGLYTSPEKAFQGFLKAAPNERSGFLLHPEHRFFLSRILERAEVKKVDGEKSRVVLTLAFKDPYSQQDRVAKAAIPYVEANGLYKIDSQRVNLSQVVVVLANKAYPLDKRLGRIQNIPTAVPAAQFSEQALTDALGPPEVTDISYSSAQEKQLVEQSRKLYPDDPAFKPRYLYFFGNGDATFKNEYYSQDGRESRLHLEYITGPSIRTANGLGVGSHLDEFRKDYQVIGPGPYKTYDFDMIMPVAPSGKLTTFALAAVREPNSTDAGNLLYLDENDKVIAIAAKWGTQHYEMFK